MDMQIVQQAIEWIQNNVGDRTTKQEVVQKADASNLPGEAKSAIRDLPEGEHSKESIISALKDKVMAGVGGRMSGGMGGMGGGQGGQGQGGQGGGLGGMFGR